MKIPQRPTYVDLGETEDILLADFSEFILAIKTAIHDEEIEPDYDEYDYPCGSIVVYEAITYISPSHGSLPLGRDWEDFALIMQRVFKYHSERLAFRMMACLL